MKQGKENINSCMCLQQHSIWVTSLKRTFKSFLLQFNKTPSITAVFVNQPSAENGLPRLFIIIANQQRIHVNGSFHHHRKSCQRKKRIPIHFGRRVILRTTIVFGPSHSPLALSFTLHLVRDYPQVLKKVPQRFFFSLCWPPQVFACVRMF